jgi:glucose-1-phosphate thymidylyltransferase
MKGIILAGGSGTRLYPQFQRLLGNGSEIGINLQYAAQPKPEGLAQAFIIGEEFIGTDKVALILGDNIFYGEEFGQSLKDCNDPDGGIVFAYQVSDPERYGVVEFDQQMKAVSVEEKPAQPKSNFAVVGLYFYDNEVVNIAKNIQPSDRGELEITTVNEEYLKRGKLKVQTMERGSAWLDTGTFESMNDATEYIRVVEKRTGIKIGCIEEVAYRDGFIDAEQLRKLAEPLQKSGYGQYLISLTG